MDIVIMIDESASMLNHKQDYITGINNIIHHSRQNKDNVISVIKFNSYTTPLFCNKNNNMFISDDDYKPQGGTAFYNAIVETIRKRQRVNDKCVYIILSDGEDNIKSEICQEIEAQTLIDKERDNNSVFIFISPLDNCQEFADELGVDYAVQYSQSKRSINKVMSVITDAITMLSSQDKIKLSSNVTDKELERLFNNMTI